MKYSRIRNSFLDTDDDQLEIFGLGGSSGNPAEVDNSNNYLVVMSDTHAKIHLGTFYVVSQLVTSLSNGSDIWFYVVPVANTPHMRVTGIAGGDSRIRVYENPTISANGTAASVVNQNRISTNVASTLVYTGPTISDNGTLIDDTLIAAGTGGNSGGGSANLFEEIILKSANTYLIRLTNISGTATTVNLKLAFYEN